LQNQQLLQLQAQALQRQQQQLQQLAMQTLPQAQQQPGSLTAIMPTAVAPPAMPTAVAPPTMPTALAPASMPTAGSVIDVVCAMQRDGDGNSGSLQSMVGLPQGMCAAWSNLKDRDDIRSDCMHMFEKANTGEMDIARATRCATALSSDLRMPANNILNCVAPTSAVGVAGRDACSSALRSALILSGNEPIMTAMRDSESVKAKGGTTQPEQIQRIKEIIQERNPTTEHVTELAHLCKWDKGQPRDLEAHTALSKMFMGMRPQDRDVCNMSNDNCAAIGSVGEMCNAIDNKIGTMAFMAKVDDFYDRGGFGGIGHQLARAAEIWPEPFNETFNDVLYACGINRSQADIVNALIDSSETAIVRNSDICDRIDRKGSILLPMTSSIAAIARV
jgi:hypothetical protein